MSRRLTCDRFFGGVDHRIRNLQLFLAYLWARSPTVNETHAWLDSELGGHSEKTRDRYLSFLQNLTLVEQIGSQFHPGPAGVRYLKNPEPSTLFTILDAGVAGFDLILDALAAHGALTDEELRHVLNQGPYGHDMDGTGVAQRHREWLQALGYVQREKSPDGTRRVGLTESGYELWAAYDDGTLSEEATPEPESPTHSPLQSIPDDPVPPRPDESEDPETIQYQAPTTQQRTAAVAHQQALDDLRAEFVAAGFEVKKSRYSDLIAYKDPSNEIFLFEVKSITDENMWSQIRTAVGQVFEYEYRDIHQRDELTGEVRPGLLLSQAPPNDVQAYLSHLAATQRLLVVWWDETLSGPSTEDLSTVLSD